MQSVDGDLAASAQAYIASLKDPFERERAREYARMDAHSFQARIGPGLDDLAAGQQRILSKLQENKQVLEAGKRSFSRRAIAVFVLLGAGAAEGMLRVFGKTP